MFVFFLFFSFVPFRARGPVGTRFKRESFALGLELSNAKILQSFTVFALRLTRLRVRPNAFCVHFSIVF